MYKRQVDAVDKYDVVIMNFANGDMVGHTGFVEAGIAACAAVDSALEKCVKKLLELGGDVYKRQMQDAAAVTDELIAFFHQGYHVFQLGDGCFRQAYDFFQRCV